MTLGPRLWSSTSAATEAPATVGTPSTGVSPPTTSTSPSCTMVPTSPSILVISSTSSGTTRYCRPPVLMTANIFFVLRVRSRPRERRAGFLFSRYGFVVWVVLMARLRGCPQKGPFEGFEDVAQKQTARERPAPDWRHL